MLLDRSAFKRDVCAWLKNLKLGTVFTVYWYGPIRHQLAAIRTAPSAKGSYFRYFVTYPTQTLCFIDMGPIACRMVRW